MLKIIVCAVVVAAVSPGLFAGAASAAETYTGVFSNVAVGGYDPVSYFVGEGRPVRGDRKFTVSYAGADYRFASAANAARFKANPAAFVPQYGGHCAWAAAQNYTAPGDPKYYRIVRGKLYLNYNAKVQSDWAKDIPGFIASADRNWPTLAKE